MTNRAEIRTTIHAAFNLTTSSNGPGPIRGLQSARIRTTAYNDTNPVGI